MALTFGDRVTVTLADGTEVGRIYLGGPMPGTGGASVIWVADIDEWDISARTGSGPEGTPYPAADVRPG